MIHKFVADADKNVIIILFEIVIALLIALLISIFIVFIFYRRKKKNREKQSSELFAILENILNNIDAQIYVTIPSTGELIFANKRIKTLFNKEDENLTGQYCYKVFRDADEVCQYCPCFLLDKNPDQMIVWKEHFQPLDIHVRHTDCYIDWPGRGKVHLQYTTEITDLVKAKEEVERNSRIKIDFLAKMSHEICTPMNAIIGMTELAINEETPDAKNEHMYTVKQAGSNLLAIINDILDFSKIEAGKLEITQNDYLLSSLLSDVVSIIRIKALDMRLRFAVKVDSNTPAALYGDETRIRQVLLNILSNAFKYTEKGHVIFTVYSQPADNIEQELTGNMLTEDKINLIFEITDTGIGIKPEDMDKLFNDFTRLDPTKNYGIEGSGLGLALSQSIVETMGGSISVKSQYGAGSTFTVTIPQACRGSDVIAKVDHPEIKNVLIYERRDIYVDSLRYSLNSLKVSYTLVRNGIELYEKLSSGTYDYLFMSYTLYVKNEDTILKFGKGINIAVLAEFGEVIPEKYHNALSMPIYCTHVANVLNGVYGNLTYNMYDDNIVKFSAPDARILIVDDIRTNLKVAEGLLKSYNMHIDTCISGSEAIQAIENAAKEGYYYDLVLMDSKMPGLNGIETTKRIRDMANYDSHFKKLPIIVTTANTATGITDTYTLNGFSDYLTKPINTAKLNAILKKWIPYDKQEFLNNG